MLVKLILIALLLFIVFNLFRALWLMLKNDPNKVSMSKYLGRRVLFSAIVMALLIVALAMGWVSPHQRPY